VRRLLFLGLAITVWACLLGVLTAARTPWSPKSPVAAAARVIVPGTEDVLALQQAADVAETAVDARNPHNLVFTADHSVFAPVGTYSDCTGRQPLTHTAAAIDTCITGLHYFIGHNPGVFTGLMDARAGSVIGYYDARGRLHRYQVVTVRTWLRSSGVPAPVRPDEAAQFQTCVTLDGSVDRILDAIEL
jgi:hypothetical protein